jgi:hypothetical protein
LERIELNASASSVSFQNIPQSGYTDLKIVVSARSSTGIYQTDCNIQVGNGSVDTGSNYQTKELYGDGTSVGSGSFTTTNIHPPIAGAGATSNTFGNFEIYIPNYTSSSQKSISCDVVTEHNSANAAARLAAYLWTGTSAINIITLTAAATSFVQYSTFSLYGLAALGTTPVIAPKAYGGTMTYDGTYWYHTFLSSGTFTPLQSLTADYLVVAGGGGGSQGGGGAGGLRCTVGATGGGGSLETALSLVPSTSYTVTIGAGGTGSTDEAVTGTNGSNSVFATITSNGGGTGGTINAATPSGTFGSGGGGGASAGSSQAGASGTANQGFAGGSNSSNRGNPYPSGGGGGAGAVGVNGSGTTLGGAGGAGVATSISGSSVTYAGGGGGSVYNTGGTGGAGGAGGGGAGQTGGGGNGGSGATNRGSGGGGAGRNFALGGNGGSGIVIVRYLA